VPLASQLRADPQDLGRGAEGGALGIPQAGTLREVLERERRRRGQLEEAVSAVQQLFARAFEDSPIGMALVTLDGVALAVNPALASFLGYAPRELLGRSVADVTPPEEVPAARMHLLRALGGAGDRYRLDKHYIHRNGYLVPATITVSLVRDEAGRPFSVFTQVEGAFEGRRLPLRSAALMASAADRFRRLSAREREVLGHVIAGHKSAEIAERLGISPRTVEVHRRSVMRKMEARSVAELVRTALALPLKAELRGGRFVWPDFDF
jgi:PAS domain S-box-containing protein